MKTIFKTKIFQTICGFASLAFAMYNASGNLAVNHQNITSLAILIGLYYRLYKAVSPYALPAIEKHFKQ